MVLPMLLILVNLRLSWLLSMLLDRFFSVLLSILYKQHCAYPPDNIVYGFLLLVMMPSFLDIVWYYLLYQCYAASRPVILEPVMLVELKVPTEFQGAVAGDINK